MRVGEIVQGMDFWTGAGLAVGYVLAAAMKRVVDAAIGAVIERVKGEG